jgi:hypothetical protein
MPDVVDQRLVSATRERIVHTAWRQLLEERLTELLDAKAGNALRPSRDLRETSAAGREAPGSGLGSHTRCGYLCHPRCPS